MINTLRPLTQEQRQSARQAAQAAVIRAAGGRPNREHFSHTTTTKYPPAVTRLIVSLCLILLLAAFTPSAIRLYVIGSQTFSQAVPNPTAENAVGLATVLSAEIGQVVFSLALATLGASRSSRCLLYSSMAITTCLALTGNVQVGLAGSQREPIRLAGGSRAAHRAPRRRKLDLPWRGKEFGSILLGQQLAEGRKPARDNRMLSKRNENGRRLRLGSARPAQ